QGARGQKGTAHAYNIKSQRDQERRWVEQAEAAYARFVAGWNPRGERRARAPQRRSDDKGCAAGLAPRALLFATRSPVRHSSLARIAEKSACRSHQWFAGSWSWCGCDRRPRPRDSLVFVALTAAELSATIGQH